MPFRVKDILIDVVQAQPCPQNSLIFCHFQCSFQISWCHFGCTFQLTNPCTFHTLVTCPQHTIVCPTGSIVCPGGTVVCPGGSIQCTGSIIDPGLNPEAVRERLKAQLAIAKIEEEAASEAMKPQTLEQVDLLEGKLKEALAELDRRRGELKKAK